MNATFDNTVSILVKAYMNDTLEVGNFCACAVGNLMAEAVGAQFVKRGGQLDWVHKLYSGGEWYQPCDEELEAATQLVEATGYSFEDIMRIEKVFENAAYSPHYDSSKMFNGLMAVVDVIADIHGINLEQKESAKALFVK